jgi:hypothetical protein
MALEKFKAPPLPLPNDEYDRLYFQQLIRILGIYFSQLDSKTPNIAESYRADNFYGGDFDGGTFTGTNFDGGLFTGDGYGLKLPHVAASDSTDQIAGGNDTPTVVKWNTLDSAYGWTLNSPGSATADIAGVYKICYSLQLVNSANAIHFATAWLRVNTNDVDNSATTFAIPAAKNNNTPSYVCGYSEVTFTVDVGDEIELYWATDLAGDPDPISPVNGVYILHDAAQVSPYPRPAIPSAIGSITFVSAIP